MMARRARVYPQVDPGASGLIDATIVSAPARASVGRALARARARGAVGVTVGDAPVLHEDLARAAALGLDGLGAVELSRPLPVVESATPEVAVRRHLGSGAPMVIVRERGRVAGAVTGGGMRVDDTGGLSLLARVGSALPSATRTLLATIGELASDQGSRAFLVGGLVRDLLLARDVMARDVDVVVEGDGMQVARDLAARLRARLVEHRAFHTASVEIATGAVVVQRIDVATARTERYEDRGALPRVAPADILADLGRRDFSVNAMAIELASGRFRLLDPLGGRADLAAHRLRALHPLSFVEDPTRIFRAARYATRLGLGLEARSQAWQRLALRLVPYPRLSGQRVVAEVDHILADVDAGSTLERLGTAHAFRLLDPRYRFTRLTATRLHALEATLRWAVRSGLEFRPYELALLTVLADQTPAVVAASLRRLALTGETLARLERGAETATSTIRALPATRSPSTRARLLRGLHGLELAWVRMVAGARVRAILDWFVESARRTAPTLRGNELVALGVPRGPSVARTLERLVDARLDGTIVDVAGERTLVQAVVAGHARSTGTRDGKAQHPVRGEI